MKDQLIEWKSKYGAVYQITLDDIHVYYRSLTSWATQSILELQESNKAKIDIEIAMLSMAILEPTPIPQFKRPGTISSLATEIWLKSFPTEDTLPKTAADIRAWAGANVKRYFGLALSCIMCKVMPSLYLSRLLDLPLSKLLKLAAIVEEMTGQSLILDDGTTTTSTSPINLKTYLLS